jgi:serine/threonine protein kinase
LKILQACKDENVSKRSEVFIKQVDIYSYGMTCCEILTGKLPFGGHSLSDYDLVLNGGRLEVPKYIDDWVHGLFNWSWQPNAIDSPLFGDILNLHSLNLARVKKYRAK